MIIEAYWCYFFQVKVGRDIRAVAAKLVLA